MSVAAVNRMNGIGFLDPGADREMSFASYEGRADYWEKLGITASSEHIDGADYHWDKDDFTLRLMADRYQKTYAGQLAERVRAANSDPLRGATASTDIGTLPLFLDRGFFDVTPKDMILAQDLRRTPHRAKTVDWNVQTASDDAVFAATENPAIVDQDETYVGQVLNMSVIYGRITLTGLSLAVADPFVNLMNYSVQRRMRAIMELIEQTTLTGDGAAGSWEGMQNLFTTNVDSIGGVITLDDIDDHMRTVWNSGGNPDRAIAPHQVVNDIGKLLRDNQRVDLGAQTTAIGGWQGLRNFVVYNGIPIFGSRFMPDTPNLRELYHYQQDILDYPILHDIQLEPLAKTGDAEQWLIKTYMTFRDLSGTDGTGGGGTFHGKIDTIA